MSEHWRCRIYDARPPGDDVVHAAMIVPYFEFVGTLCGMFRSIGCLYEAPRGSLVTCLHCLAVMFAKGDRWT